MVTSNTIEKITQISLYHRRYDGVITKTIKNIPRTGIPWSELLVEFVDMLKALEYDIPINYDDFMNLLNEYVQNETK